MFCPLCHAEYREGFTVCSTCRAGLVAADAPGSERTPPRLKWVTHDQRESDAVFGKLFEAGIPCQEKAQTGFFSVTIARPRPTITLYILERDASAARQATGLEFLPDVPTIYIPEGAPVQDCPFCSAKFPAGQNFCPFCCGDVLEWKPGGEAESAPPPGSDASGPVPASATTDDGEAQLVWRGDDPVAFSRALEALKENGIQAHTLSTSEHMAFEFAMPRPKMNIFVPGADAARAVELASKFQSPFPLVAEDSFAPADPSIEMQAIEMQEDKLLGAGPPIAARKSSLRWGFGLLLSANLMLIWVNGTAMPGWVFHPGVDGTRYAALLTLIAVGFISALAGFWKLYRAWNWRRDKTGMLALLFALQGSVMFCAYAAWALR